MADGSGWTDERVALIKKTICPKGISDDEFALFLEQCKRSGLDPLLKEAFCVGRRQNIGNRDKPNWVTKHEFQPSEAGMLARAERFPDYRGIQASAVYAEDEILVDQGKGEVTHSFNPAKRKGALVGAWARIVRENRLPVVVWLDFSGYVQQTPLWSKIPVTMIEKCARVAALRKAYPEAFGGLYVKEEMPAEEFPEEAAPADQTKSEKVRASMPAKTATREAAEVAEAEFTHVTGERRATGETAARVAKPAEVTNFPKGVPSLTPEQQATAEKAASMLGGQVQPPAATEPDSEDEALADAIVAEAEAAQSEKDIRALSGNAKKLPDGPLKARAADALKAACKRLGIQPAAKKAASIRQPGEEG